jgi:hypothetical protein
MPPMIPSGHSLLVELDTGKRREDGRLSPCVAFQPKAKTQKAEQTELTSFIIVALIAKPKPNKRCLVVLT